MVFYFKQPGFKFCFKFNPTGVDTLASFARNNPITIGIDDERHDNQKRRAHAIKVPSALLSNAADTTPLNNLYQLSNNLSKPNHRHGNHKSLILIVTLQSGRFAAALFHQQKCIHHTTSTRYTARKGQGGAQSSNDNAKGKAKSVGSQLRRAGEVQLRNDVKDMFIRWKDDLIHNTALFMSAVEERSWFAFCCVCE